MDARAADAVLLLADVLIKTERYADARPLLEGLLEANAEDARARRALTLVYLRLGRYADAEPLARELASSEAGAERAPALFMLAHAQWGAGALEESARTVEEYVRAHEAATE